MDESDCRRYPKIKRSNLLTVWTVWRQGAVHDLIAVLHVRMEISTTTLVKISNIDITIGIWGTDSSTAETIPDAPRGYVTIALGVLGTAGNRHLLRLAVPGPVGLLHLLLLVVVLLQVSMSLRMCEILLIAIRLETAACHLILGLGVKTVLDVDTLAATVVGMRHLLHASCRRREGVGIDLGVVAAGVVGASLHHINPAIGRAKFFHYRIVN